MTECNLAFFLYVKSGRYLRDVHGGCLSVKQPVLKSDKATSQTHISGNGKDLAPVVSNQGRLSILLGKLSWKCLLVGLPEGVMHIDPELAAVQDPSLHSRPLGRPSLKIGKWLEPGAWGPGAHREWWDLLRSQSNEKVKPLLVSQSRASTSSCRKQEAQAGTGRLVVRCCFSVPTDIPGRRWQ